MAARHKTPLEQPGNSRQFWWGAAAWLCLASLAWGQFGVARRPANTASANEADAWLVGGTPLDVDRDLQQLLSRAEQLASEGRNTEAIRLWQSALNPAKNSLTTREHWNVQTFGQRKYTIYRPLAHEIERSLAALPEEDLNFYRQTFDADAKTLLEQTGNATRPMLLEEVVDQFFLSSLGDESAYYLALWRFDQGDFVGAARLLQKILNHYPQSDLPRTQLLLRLTLACARIGDEPTARTAWADYQLLAGKNVTPELRDLVDHELAQALDSPAWAGDSLGWSMRFGGPARNRDMPALPANALAEQLSETWVQAFETQLQQPAASTSSNVQSVVMANGQVIRMVRNSSGRSTASPRKSLLEEWLANGWMPSRQLYFDKERLYVNGNGRVTCCNAGDGRVLWMGRRYQYESDRASQTHAAMQSSGVNGRRPTTLPEIQLFGDRLHSLLTLHDRVLYALEGELLDWGVPPREEAAAASSYVMNTRRTRRNWLAAYEADTGKLKWHRPAGDNAQDEENPPAGFLAAPVPFADRLLIPVVENGELWLYSLHQSTGQTDWKIFLWDEPLEGVNPWSSVGLAVEGGDLYLATGMGLIFALDAATGKVHWATRYGRHGFRPVNARALATGAIPASSTKGWLEDVVIPHGNALVVLPSDDDHLFALDRRTGTLLWDSPQVPFEGDPQLHIESDPMARYCLGVSRQGLFVGGRRVLRKYNVLTGRLLWEFPVADSLGQAALTRNAIFVPTPQAILQIDPDTGEEIARAEVYTPTGEPLGNLFSNGRQLFGVGPQRIYALASLSDRLKSLAERIADGDGQAQLIRMRINVQRGDRPAALADLEAAGDKIRQREGWLNAWTMLYGALEEFNVPEQDPETALRLMVRASAPAMAEESREPELPSDIHSTLETKRDALIYAALRALDASQQPNAMPVLLEATVLCTSPHLESFARRMVSALAKPEDQSRLLSAFERGPLPTRLAAAEGLLKLSGETAQDVIPILLNDPEDRLRLRGAQALANQGERKVLPILAGLMESDELNVRAQSASILRALTRQNFPYTAYQEPEIRQARVAQWRAWIAADGQTAPLHFPIQFDGQERGRTLYTNYSTGFVYELDSQGEIVWKRGGISTPWACQGLPNGHRLISSYNGKSVIEFDDQGQEVWKKTNLPGQPLSVQRLPNGNTLVACLNSQVYEFAPDGSIAWQVAVGGTPRSAERLDNGNTLLALSSQNQVVELNPAGKVVWSVNNAYGPMSVQRLGNGHTLVCQSSTRRLVELDAAGKIVWSQQWPSTSTLYHAQRLDNGHTLVADSTGWKEIDERGKVVKQKAESGIRAIHRY